MDAKISPTISASIDDANMKNMKIAISIGIILFLGIIIGYVATKQGILM
jgi:hypothetical protein